MNNNNFGDVFSQLFGNSTKSNCDTCGYKTYSDKIKYIKNKMKNDKQLALNAENRKEYLEIINKSYCDVLKYIRNI